MKLFIAFLIVVFFTNGYAEATGSTISEASGFFSDGQNISLAGSSFGIHSAIGNIEWLKENIDTGTSGASFSKTKWTNSIDAYSTSLIYDSTQKHSGSNSLKANWTGDKYDSYIVYDSGSTFNSAFISFWTKFNPVVGGSCAQWKAWNLTSSSTSFNSTNDTGFARNSWYSTTNNTWCNIQRFFFQVNGGSTTGPGGNINPPYKVNTWIHEEAWIVRASAPNKADGTYLIKYSDGSTNYNTYDGTSGYITHLDGANEWRYLAFGKYWGNVDTGVSRNASAWYDDIYIQVGTQARVELCDSPDWSNRKHCEIQFPTAWSNDTIAIKFNQGSFLSGDQAYFYIITADGTPSVPKGITIGGSSLPSPIKTDSIIVTPVP